MGRLRTLGAEGEVDRSKKGLHIEALGGNEDEPVSLGDRGDDRRPSPWCHRERSVFCRGSRESMLAQAAPVPAWYPLAPITTSAPGHCRGGAEVAARG